jgi:hypothetical protein
MVAFPEPREQSVVCTGVAGIKGCGFIVAGVGFELHPPILSIMIL